jgi:hypothetical protein
MCDYCRNSAGALLLLALAGCSDKDITTYRIPKEGAPGAAPLPGSAPAAPSALVWRAPAGWEALPGSGLRLASFRAPGPGGTSADVSIFIFAGTGGDPLANINRWRAQLKLQPIPAERLPSEVTGVDSPAGTLSLADIQGASEAGKPATRIFGAWLRRDERVWFFKMMGPAPAVDAQKEAFMGLLRSVAPGAAPAESVPVLADASQGRMANTNDLPPDHIVVAPTDAPGGPSLAWTAPAGWTPKAATAIRKGSFAISRGGAEADLAITAFPGDVGGVAANVNRWRGQLGLGTLDDTDIGTVTESLNSNGLHFILVDFSAPAGADGQRILAALASWRGATWFFKLTGPSELVEGERPEFVSFLRTVRPR